MSEEKKTAKTMPKGGRKGGSTFPRVALTQAVAYAKKLAAKTHSGPQPRDVLLTGVFGNKGPMGGVRLSAVTQFGFVQGDSDNGYEATQVAKDLVAAPPDELQQHLRAAILRPRIFKSLFDTYHGDKVTHAKLKQRAAALEVHPELTQSCVDIYLESAQYAGLVSAEGDLFSHIPDSQLNAGSDGALTQGAIVESADLDADAPEQQTSEADTATTDSSANGGQTGDSEPARPRAIFNVNITLDSSLDTEKLQKQLELLKKFGAL